MTIIQAQPLKTYGITGPASAMDNEVPLFSGTSGKVIKGGSGLVISANLMQAENKALLLEGATGATPTSGAGTYLSELKIILTAGIDVDKSEEITFVVEKSAFHD